MNKLFNKPTVYISHPIRGSTGDMKGNCKRAIDSVKKLRQLFPEINWYLPAESDIIVQLMYDAGVVDETAILDSDLDILRNCNGHLWLMWDKSNGCLKEVSEALIYNLPHENTMNDLRKINYTKLRRMLIDFIEKVIKNYKERK